MQLARGLLSLPALIWVSPSWRHCGAMANVFCPSGSLLESMAEATEAVETVEAGHHGPAVVPAPVLEPLLFGSNACAFSGRPFHLQPSGSPAAPLNHATRCSARVLGHRL